jgi:hypothetical protein
LGPDHPPERARPRVVFVSYSGPARTRAGANTAAQPTDPPTDRSATGAVQGRRSSARPPHERRGRGRGARGEIRPAAAASAFIWRGTYVTPPGTPRVIRLRGQAQRTTEAAHDRPGTRTRSIHTHGSRARRHDTTGGSRLPLPLPRRASCMPIWRRRCVLSSVFAQCEVFQPAGPSTRLLSCIKEVNVTVPAVFRWRGSQYIHCRYI